MRWGKKFRRPLRGPAWAQPTPWRASEDRGGQMWWHRCGGTDACLVQPGWGKEGPNTGGAGLGCSGIAETLRGIKVQECPFNILLLKRRTLNLKSKRREGTVWSAAVGLYHNANLQVEKHRSLCPRPPERLHSGTHRCVLWREDAHNRTEHTGEWKTW